MSGFSEGVNGAGVILLQQLLQPVDGLPDPVPIHVRSVRDLRRFLGRQSALNRRDDTCELLPDFLEVLFDRRFG